MDSSSQNLHFTCFYIDIFDQTLPSFITHPTTKMLDPIINNMVLFYHRGGLPLHLPSSLSKVQFKK